MIETALVYIRANNETRAFVGCGAFVEGPFIVTCRHVWRDAGGDDLGGVVVEFPRPDGEGVVQTRQATIFDDCGGPEGRLDIVILNIDDAPAGAFPLHPAPHERYETGAGTIHAFIPSRGEDVFVNGVFADATNARGMRQVTGTAAKGYWTERGSSGAPAYKDGGAQLAGLLRLSEVGDPPLLEAFVIPGTAILPHLERARKTRLKSDLSRETGIAPKHLQPLFEAVGQDVPSAQFEQAIRAAVEALLEKSRDKVEPMNDGLAVLEAIRAARARLAELDAEGAVDVLDRAIAEMASIREAATKGEARLLAEKADIFAISYQWDRALQALARAAELEPDNAWHRFRSGDTHVHQGRLAFALSEYQAGGKAAKRSGDDRDLSVSHNRIGEVRVAQGDLAGGLAAYEAGLAIADRLAGSDPSNSEWQRDLSVSHNRIGDVRVAQGDLAGALAAYEATLKIAETLAGSDPSNSGWQRDLSVSHDRIGDVRVAQGDLAGALAAYEAGLAIRQRLAGSDPSNSGWQRDLSVSHNKIGDVRVAQGDLAGALAAYEVGLAIADRLAGSDPSNSGWQRDLIVSHVKLAEAGAEPMAHFQAALAIARKLMREGRLAPADHFIPGMLEDRLTALRGE